MKIVVDMNLSPEWVPVLQRAGYEARHWSDLGPQDSADEEIIARAERDGAVILTRDLDFGAYLALTGQSRPSVVQVRARRATPGRYAELVLQALNQTCDALEKGALVTIDLEQVRVRLLPFPSSR